MTGLRILFMGTPEFACPTLARLMERGENVIAVVTQPDRPKGRGQKEESPPVKQLALTHGIPVLQPVKLRTPDSVAQIRELAPDLIVVVAFGQILPQSLLDIPPRGCINVHSSLLPRYRGAAPLNWVIINGETETGVTTMLMDAGLDTGDMLLVKRTPIHPDENASSLHDRMALLGAEALAETLDLLVAGQLVPVKQDNTLTCYAPLMKKETGEIDWTRSPDQIRNLVRGVTPWPGAYTRLNGLLLKVYRVETARESGEPGLVLAAGKEGIQVACSEGSIVIQELQLEGKKRLSARDFLAGYALPSGLRLGKDIA
jgi:methionyl-tRNA formyltransferase